MHKYLMCKSIEVLKIDSGSENISAHHTMLLTSMYI